MLCVDVQLKGKCCLCICIYRVHIHKAFFKKKEHEYCPVLCHGFRSGSLVMPEDLKLKF